MSDTIVMNCIKCHQEKDCINGMCEPCACFLVDKLSQNLTEKLHVCPATDKICGFYSEILNCSIDPNYRMKNQIYCIQEFNKRFDKLKEKMK